MKRNKNLHPLSWQHHSGLLIARRIKKGVANGSDITVIAHYMESMWNEHLNPHFKLEEDHLLPPMENLTEAAELIERFNEEHALMRKQIQEILCKPTYAKLEEFSMTLTNHIHFEEKEFFPLAERIIPEKELDRIGRFFHEAYAEKQVDWRIPFWKD